MPSCASKESYVPVSHVLYYNMNYCCWHFNGNCCRCLQLTIARKFFEVGIGGVEKQMMQDLLYFGAGGGGGLSNMCRFLV